MERGQSEFQILAKSQESLLEKGIRPIVMMIADDERALNFKHPLTVGKKLERNLIFVIMTMKWGLMVAFSRLVFFGAIPDELRKKQDAVAKVDAVYILNTKPNELACNVLAKGIKVYSETGDDGYWKHHYQRGPTGYELRSYFTNLSTKEVVQENQAFAWNPVIDGMKYEDTFIVINSGPKFLTSTGNWPMLDISLNGLNIKRPDVLIK